MALPGDTNADRSTSKTETTVIWRTNADGSTRKIIMTNGGNYNKRIDGNHVHKHFSNHAKSDVERDNYYESGSHTDNQTSTTQPK